VEDKKLFAGICPKCGNKYKEKEIAKLVICGQAHINMMCENGHKWTEFYSLCYQGYWNNGSIYDSFGELKQ
jgi:predicted nucleic-acid-binding Zn-ribbon protein